ncbi:hypothetical protein CERZMDRAFT_95580 [Cercospora zeae-maydis SCOH1-5]|uniref:Condensation domain-containing protein n=1 Tax=Cercospora zeae-maydis SCOH1-5 TaxID=717836 RepID=A0A6A6FLW9_9PEZI|nr:hypothetical protein CERZMDRAFT_95580 [Cercospora zeae-maydis SCOH1-5]
MSVDLGRVVQCWKALVRRHDTLRTIFIEHVPDVGPVRAVLREIEPCITVSKAASPEENFRSKKETCNHLAQRWVRIWQCEEPASMILSLTIRHALLDAASLELVTGELRSMYVETELPAAVSFNGYAVQMQRQSPAALKESQDSWATKLSGIDACHMPEDSYWACESRTEQVTLPSLKHAQLRGFCKRSATSASSIFYLAWAMTLQAYTGSFEALLSLDCLEP